MVEKTLQPHQKNTKQNLNAKAIQTVIDELSKRKIIALRQGIGKILIGRKISAKVHAKRDLYWPALKGLKGRDLLILVDYKQLKPEFYILNIDDWKIVAKRHIDIQIEKDLTNKDEVSFDPPHYIPVWENQLKKDGKPYTGASLAAKEVKKCKNRWDKIELLLA